MRPTGCTVSLRPTVPPDWGGERLEKMTIFPNKPIISSLKRKYPSGTRVRLVKMNDPQAPPVGTIGTVMAVDDIGSLLMKWDNGCGLNVAYGEDIVEIVKGGVA